MLLQKQICTKCNSLKDYSEYPKASIKASGVAGECKECKKIRTSSLRKEREIELLNRFNYECLDCKIKETNPSFFDFHHLDRETKSREVKTIICGSYETFIKEVNKCVMLCPNCHRKRHLKEGW